MWCSLCVYVCVYECVYENVGPTANALCDPQDPVWMHAQHQCTHSIILAQNKQSASVLAHGMQQCGPVLVFPVLARPSFAAYLLMTCAAKPRTMSGTQAAPWRHTTTYEFQQVDNLLLWEAKLLPSGPIWMDSPPQMRSWICTVMLYKVVQIWPELIAACLHTNQSRSYLNHLVYIGYSLSQLHFLYMWMLVSLLSHTCSWTSYTAIATP